MASTIPFPNKNDKGFYADIIEDGYHIFSCKSAKIPDFYPNEFPDYTGVKFNELSIGDRITIRAFFRIGPEEEPMKVYGGYLDLEIEHIDSDHILGKILTKLPEEFPLSAGSSLEIAEGEILYKGEDREH